MADFSLTLRVTSASRPNTRRLMHDQMSNRFAVLARVQQGRKRHSLFLLVPILVATQSALGLGVAAVEAAGEAAVEVVVEAAVEAVGGVVVDTALVSVAEAEEEDMVATITTTVATLLDLLTGRVLIGMMPTKGSSISTTGSTVDSNGMTMEAPSRTMTEAAIKAGTPTLINAVDNLMITTTLQEAVVAMAGTTDRTTITTKAREINNGMIGLDQVTTITISRHIEEDTIVRMIARTINARVTTRPTCSRVEDQILELISYNHTSYY